MARLKYSTTNGEAGIQGVIKTLNDDLKIQEFKVSGTVIPYEISSFDV